MAKPNFTLPQNIDKVQLDGNNQPVAKPNFTLPDGSTDVSPVQRVIPESFTLGEQYAESYDLGKHYQIPLQDWRGELQSRTEKWGRTIPRFLSRASTQVLATPGYLVAGLQALGDKTLAETLDNAYLNALNNFDDAAKEEFNIYAPKSVREGGLWDNISSTSFWTNEGTDAAAFFASMMVPGYALKGLGLAARYGEALNVSTKWANNLELGTVTVLNTVGESMAEANDTRRTLGTKLQEMVQNGEIDQEEADKRLAEATSDTFKANMGILLLPNLLTNKLLLGRFAPEKNSLKRIMSDAVGVPVKDLTPYTTRQLAGKYLKTMGLSTFSEGFFEEGLQGTVQKVNEELALKGRDMNGISEFAEKYLDFIGTTEGQKAVLLGGVLGSIAGAAGTYRDVKAEDSQLSELSKMIQEHWEGFGTDVQGIVDSDGKVDPQRFGNYIRQIYPEQKAQELMNYFALRGERDKFDYLQKTAFARAILPMLGVEDAQPIIDKLVEHTSNETLKNYKALGYTEAEEKAFLDSRKKLVDTLQSSYRSFNNSIENLRLRGGTLKQQNEYLNKLKGVAMNLVVTSEFLKDELTVANNKLTELRAKEQVTTSQIQSSEFLSDFSLSSLESMDLKYYKKKVDALTDQLKDVEKNLKEVVNRESQKKLYGEFLENTKAKTEVEATTTQAVNQAVRDDIKTNVPEIDNSGLNIAQAFANSRRENKDEFVEQVKTVFDGAKTLLEPLKGNKDDIIQNLEIPIIQLEKLGFTGQRLALEKALASYVGFPIEYLSDNKTPEDILNSPNTVNSTPSFEDEGYDEMAEMESASTMDSILEQRGQPAPAEVSEANTQTKESGPATKAEPQAKASAEPFNGVRAFEPYVYTKGSDAMGLYFKMYPHAHVDGATYTLRMKDNPEAGKIINLPTWTKGINSRRSERKTIEIWAKNPGETTEKLVGYLPDPEIYIHPTTGQIVDPTQLTEEEYKALFPVVEGNYYHDFTAFKEAYLNAKILYDLALNAGTVDLTSLGAEISVVAGTYIKIKPGDNLTQVYHLPNQGMARFTDLPDGKAFVLAELSKVSSEELDSDGNYNRPRRGNPALVNAPRLAKNSVTGELHPDVEVALTKLAEYYNKTGVDSIGWQSRYALLVPNAGGTIMINDRPHSWVFLTNKTIPTSGHAEIVSKIQEFVTTIKELNKANPADLKEQVKATIDAFNEWRDNTFYFKRNPSLVTHLTLSPFGRLNYLVANRASLLYAEGKPGFNKSDHIVSIPIDDVSSMTSIIAAINTQAMLDTRFQAIKDWWSPINIDKDVKAHMKQNELEALSDEEFNKAVKDNFSTLLAPVITDNRLKVVYPKTKNTAPVPEGVTPATITPTENAPTPEVKISPISSYTMSEVIEALEQEDISEEDYDALRARQKELNASASTQKMINVNDEIDSLTPAQYELFNQWRTSNPGASDAEKLAYILKCKS